MAAVMTTSTRASIHVYKWQSIVVVAVFMCPVLLPLTSASPSSWHFLTHQHAEHTDDISLTLTSSSPGKDRTRRDVRGTVNLLPPTLTFTFTVGADDIKFNLEKNDFADTSPPVFLIRDGKVLPQKTSPHQDDTAFYQDPRMKASIMARRNADGRRYQLTGSYFHRDQEYTIQPITDLKTDDVDHRIFKALGQAYPMNDVITFESGPQPADVEESLTEAYIANNNPGSSNIIRMENGSYNINIISGHSLHNLSGGNSRTGLVAYKQLEMVTQDRSSGDGGGGKTFMPASGFHVFPQDGSHVPKTVPKLRDWRGTESRIRKKRQIDHYVVELAMVIDYGVYKVWHDGVIGLDGEQRMREAVRRIKQFYSFVLNGIDLRYNSVRSLADFHMDVTWAGIIIFDSPVDGYWTNVEKPPRSSRDRVESSVALETFRSWVGKVGTGLPPSDHVMLFTGHNLTYGGSVSNAGLAYLGSACNPDYFFSIVEEYFDFRDVAIAAHELGHSLGARHDMDGNVCLSQDRYIMTSRFQFPSERKAKNPWLFSQCTVLYFKDFIQELDRNDTNCLVVQASRYSQEILPYLLALPGEVYAGDDFCRIGDGLGSYICREQHLADYRSICYSGVFCYIPLDGVCVPRLPPDGFSCGNRKPFPDIQSLIGGYITSTVHPQWCMNGTCQPTDAAPATPGDDCPFGDAPDVPGGQTCAERVMTLRSDCYRDTFRARCCASCLRHRRNLPGCEYGDQFELCQKDQCLNYDLEYARENCCDTCDELLFTLPVTMVTTVTTAATSAPPDNNSGSENVTSRTGDKSVRWRNQILSPDRTEGGERARKGEKTDRNINTNFRRRDNSESEESQDSDETTSRNYPKALETKGDTRAGSGNLGMVRNLLGDMRSSRDSNRSQRMRLLVHILDRIRRENLQEP